MFVCPSAWTNSAPTGRVFMRDLSIVRKSVEKIQVSLKSDKNNGYFTWRSMCIFDYSRPVLLSMRNVSQKVVEKNAHFIFSAPRKSCCVWNNVEKCGTAGQATDDNMAHACWVPKTTDTRVCNNCFSTAALVTRRCLSVALYVRGMSCWKFASDKSIIQLELSSNKEWVQVTVPWAKLNFVVEL